MDGLPNEIVLKIFGFLDYSTLQKCCTIVSKEWFKLIRHSKVLSGNVRVNEKILLSANITNSLDKNWPKLTNLSCMNNETIFDQILAKIDFSQLPNLKYINSKVNWKIFNREIMATRSNFSHDEFLQSSLKSLDIEFMIPEGKIENVSDVFVSLDIDAANYESKQRLVSKCKELKSIKILVDLVSYEDLNESKEQKLCEKWLLFFQHLNDIGHLSKVKSIEVKLERNIVCIKNWHLTMLSEKCVNVQNIKMQGIYVNSEAMLKWASSFKHLNVGLLHFLRTS